LKFIIVGAGEVGFHIASRLSMEDKEVVVIDNDAEHLRRIAENIDVQTIHGSGSSPTILEEAGIKDTSIFLAVTNSDETNLVSCMFANILSPATTKLVRLRNEEYVNYIEKYAKDLLRIKMVINPEMEVVKTIDRLMSIPGAVDIGEFAEGRIKLIGMRVDESCPLNGIKLFEFKTKLSLEGVLIAAIIRDEKLIIPSGNDQILPGDIVYFVAEEKQLPTALESFGKHIQPVRRVLIVGGGNVGFRLASLLEQRSVYTKLIEKDRDRCNFLAENLNNVVILQGDGSDQELLQEENIQDMDVVITLTGDEETNILTSLLAKRMGATKTVTRINKLSYFPIMDAIGIEHVVSPRLSAINTILQHIRRGKVISAISIKGEGAEVLEAVALETSDIVGTPLKKINFPKGVLVVAILRDNEVIIPTGDSIIRPNDRFIIFSTREAITKVENALMVRLEYF